MLLYHVRVDLWIGWWRITSYPNEYSSFAKAMAWLSIPTPFMGYAVVLFFLISGFCIHYPNTSANARPSWKTYLVRRFWRIYLAYFAALLLTVGISYICLTLWGDKNWDVGKIFSVASLTQNTHRKWAISFKPVSMDNSLRNRILPSISFGFFIFSIQQKLSFVVFCFWYERAQYFA